MDTAPTVALSDVQIVPVWGTHEPPKEYSDFGKVSLHTSSGPIDSRDFRLPPLCNFESLALLGSYAAQVGSSLDFPRR